MTKILTLFFAILMATSAVAQQPQRGNWGGNQQSSITGKITGTVLDSVTNVPVEYASIVLIDAKSGKEVDGTVTDEKGEFKFPSEKLGEYKVHISFLGYDSKVIDGVKLTGEKPDFDIETISLRPSELMLAEATVTGEASVVENKIDRIVYNADKDVTLGSGDATDLLRKVPLLSVDLDGNVSLRGSTNIRILINGKPSSMFNGNVADALKMFPADQIKSVEVITAPSARYDGEGTAGIINIITKKSRVDGFTGSLNLAPGNRQSTSSLNLNAAKGRFGVNGGAFAVYSFPRDGIFEFERGALVDGVRQEPDLTQYGKTESSRLGFRGNFGAYYDINAYNAINSSISFGGFTFDRDGNTDATLRFNDIEEISNRNNKSKTLNSRFDWTTDYIKKYPNSEREFSISFQLNGDISTADNKLLQTGNWEYLDIDEKSKNDGLNLETTVQTDYIHPFSKAVKLETGAKAILRNINSDFAFDAYNFDTGIYERDFSRSDEFNYDQNVYAGYISLNAKLGEKYGLLAGTRYERTEIDGNFRYTENTFTNSYSNLLPSITVSRKLKGFSSVKFSYNQRIQRPSLRFINPYVDQQDRNNITFGNPQVKPELSHNFETGYNTFFKGVVVNVSMYYRHTNDVIQQVLDVDSISITTYENAGTDNSVGLGIFGSGTIKEVWQLRGNVDIRRASLKGQVNGFDASNTGYEMNSFLSSTLSITKQTKVELWAMIRTPRVTLQGTQATFWMYSIGFQQDLFNKRGSLGIRIANPFHRALHFDSDLEGADFYQVSKFEYPFRSYALSFNYRFGKLDFKAKERRSRVKNDDLKGDGNGEQNF
ncbi:MAG: outer membrane beta-barrel family protein [Saprospiraceae bacterium]